MNPTITLCIPVYRGQNYWQECWESVRPLAKKFDKVLVSFNKSEFQQQDINVLLANVPENVEYIIHDKMLPPIKHFLKYLEKIDTDYVFFLCHDDWLLEEGLLEALKLLRDKADKHISIFGAQEWIETPEDNMGITRELIAFPNGINVQDFVRLDIDKFFAFNLSGTICPVMYLKKHQMVIKEFLLGFRFDNLMVTLPETDSIYQTYAPSVRIRKHANQAGKIPAPKERAFDNITYYFFQALNSSDKDYIYKLVDQIVLFQICSRKIKTFIHFFRLFIVSRKWNTSSAKKRYILYITPRLLIFHLINFARRFSGKIKRSL